MGCVGDDRKGSLTIELGLETRRDTRSDRRGATDGVRVEAEVTHRLGWLIYINKRALRRASMRLSVWSPGLTAFTEGGRDPSESSGRGGESAPARIYLGGGTRRDLRAGSNGGRGPEVVSQSQREQRVMARKSTPNPGKARSLAPNSTNDRATQKPAKTNPTAFEEKLKELGFKEADASGLTYTMPMAKAS